MMVTAVYETKEWLRLLQMMDNANHSKDTAHSMKKEKKLNTKNKLTNLTIRKNSRYSNLSLDLTILTTVSMMEMQMSLVDLLGPNI